MGILLKATFWSAIAAIAALYPIMKDYKAEMPNKLSIIYYAPFTKMENFIPESGLKFNLSIKDEDIELNNVFFTYVTMINNSSFSIKQTDFQEKLGIKSKKKDVEIILITPCNNLSFFSNRQSVNIPRFVWTNNSSLWELEPTFINSLESECSMIIVKTNSAVPSPKDFNWSGIVISHNIEIYESMKEFEEENTKITDLMKIGVFMEPKGIFAFFVIQAILLLMYSLINKILISNKSFFWEVTSFVYIIMLITSVSQLFVQIFIPWPYSPTIIHPISWVILGLFFITITVLTYKVTTQNSKNKN